VLLGLSPLQSGYNSVVQAWASAGNESRARSWIRSMQEAGYTPDEVTFGVVMETFVKRGDAAEALKIFQEMIDSGVTPSVVNFNQLIDACGRAQPRKPEDAEGLLTSMVEARLVPTASTLRAMGRVVGRSRVSELSLELGIDWEQ
ncbi:unnamed protein product, partial [Polarella glacialis]